MGIVLLAALFGAASAALSLVPEGNNRFDKQRGILCHIPTDCRQDKKGKDVFVWSPTRMFVPLPERSATLIEHLSDYFDKELSHSEHVIMRTAFKYGEYEKCGSHDNLIKILEEYFGSKVYDNHRGYIKGNMYIQFVIADFKNKI